MPDIPLPIPVLIVLSVPVLIVFVTAVTGLIRERHARGNARDTPRRSSW